ncbi:MAG: hypothetical protein RLZZ299_638 [Pseudomonadota bacterium]|jgi:hypothetical protein
MKCLPALAALVFSRPLLAADVGFGVALDATAAATRTDGVNDTVVGVREIEGDVQIGLEELLVRADLQVDMTQDGDTLSVRPGVEQLLVAWEGVGLRAGGGVMMAPWRVESVDRWENALVNPWVGTARLTPTQLMGGVARYGTDANHVQALAGFDTHGILGAGRLPDTDAPVLGVNARVGLGKKTGSNRVVAGAWWTPGTDRLGGVQVGARADVLAAAVQGEFVGLSDGVVGGQLQAELMPALPFAPVVRGSWVDGTPGASVGARFKIPFVVAKAEASWEPGRYAGWVELAGSFSTL